jgi:nickel-dependent lactate racemase
VVVQGSRAKYTVHHRSDIDIGLRVTPEEFARIHKERFSVNVTTAKEKDAVVNSMAKGIVHANRAGMKLLREDLAEVFGLEKVDISVIRRGGEFDREPWLRL